MSLDPGELLNNRYKIVAQLGQGGFATVYRGEDTILKTNCAIKENLDYWEEAQRQFEREALILAGLRHPSLPRVTDYFIMPGQGQYLVMDFVEGYDLQTILDRVGKPLAEKQVLTWIDQICDALAYLHSQNPPIIHRDVKPANIKITPSGKAMLVDFGIAKTVEVNIKTTIGAQAVTPGYSPIEQYGQDAGKHVRTDTRADIYALGATLYTILTTHVPPESVARVMGTPLPAPRQLNSKIPTHLEQVILHAMELLATDRYATVGEFREALKKPHAITQLAQPGAGQISTAADVEAPGARRTGRPDPMPAARPIITRVLPTSRRSAVNVDWVTIPAGEFLSGEEGKRVYLPEYQISKYPITNLQYKLFLDARPQHTAPAHWKGREFPMGKARHPVTGVRLPDAISFCEWIGCRLPTEEEWEKAARGTDRRTYPWGEAWEDGKYCNNWDAKIGGTTSIDRFPEGVSPYGVWDMAGNVWEWTSTDYQGPFMHILRGGSWRLFSRFAVRISQRDYLMLDDARDDLGFRCTRSR